MLIEIDPGSGFCFGVVSAIEAAEKAINDGRRVCSLGDIVHNRIEVQRLSRLGLGIVSHEQIDRIENTDLLIRAHGEPPQTYRLAEKAGLKLIDATCPVVAKLQQIVREAHQMMQQVDGQVIIFGKKGHPEIIGLCGQAEGNVLVIEDANDTTGIDPDRPVYLLSQTTRSLGSFKLLAAKIKAEASDPQQVFVRDTICRQVSGREESLAEFCDKHDVVIFVSGRKSSNGRVLFGICKNRNPHTYLIEESSELEKHWFDGARSVGICGATSTPRWLMEQVAEHIESFTI